MINFFYFFLVIENKIDWKMDRRILNNSAYQNPLTSNPETKASQIKMITALMTKRKSPKVKMVTGKVKMIRMGFTNKFKTISTAATTIAVKKFATLMPGKMLANTTTAIALNTISINVFCMLALFCSFIRIFKCSRYFTICKTNLHQRQINWINSCLQKGQFPHLQYKSCRWPSLLSLEQKEMRYL